MVVVPNVARDTFALPIGRACIRRAAGVQVFKESAWSFTSASIWGRSISGITGCFCPSIIWARRLNNYKFYTRKVILAPKITGIADTTFFSFNISCVCRTAGTQFRDIRISSSFTFTLILRISNSCCPGVLRAWRQASESVIAPEKSIIALTSLLIFHKTSICRTARFKLWDVMISRFASASSVFGIRSSLSPWISWTSLTFENFFIHELFCRARAWIYVDLNLNWVWEGKIKVVVDIDIKSNAIVFPFFQVRKRSR